MDYEAFQKDRKAALLEKKAIFEALLQPQSKEFFYARRELIRVNFALKRIEENQYGLCINCGVPIERDLLEVLPESLVCMQCIRDNQAH